MSLQTVLGRLRTKKAAEKLSEWQEYKAKVLLPLSEGKEVDIDAVEIFLQRMGKSEEELRADVENIQHRVSLRAQMLAATQHQKRLAEVEPEIERLDREFTRVREEYAAKINPLLSIRNELSSRSSPQYFADELRRSIMDPSVIQALESNMAKRKEMRPRLEWLRTELSKNANEGLATIHFRITSIEVEIDSLEENQSGINGLADALMEHVTGRSISTRNRERIAELKQKLEPLQVTRKKYESELADLEQQLAKLLAEERALYEKAMEP